MTKKQLITFLEKMEVSRYSTIDDDYTAIYNACIEYQNESRDWSLDEYFGNFMNEDFAEEYIVNSIKNGGLNRLKFMIEGVDLNADLFLLNGYGNLENVEPRNIEDLKDDLLRELWK